MLTLLREHHPSQNTLSLPPSLSFASPRAPPPPFLTTHPSRLLFTPATPYPTFKTSPDPPRTQKNKGKKKAFAAAAGPNSLHEIIPSSTDDTDTPNQQPSIAQSPSKCEEERVGAPATRATRAARSSRATRAKAKALMIALRASS